MFLTKFTEQQICFGAGGGGGGGGGGGRNIDADMFAGSNYGPTTNAGTADARQSTYSGGSRGPSRRSVPVTGKTKSFNSKTSVSARDLSSGNVSTYKAKSGTGSVTVARGTSLSAVPTVNVAVNGGKTRSNSDVYNSKDVAAPNKTSPEPDSSNNSVTAPKKIEPENGVGGGRDGGNGRKSKASKTVEDNVALKRNARGVERYRTARSGNSMSITKRRT